MTVGDIKIQALKLMFVSYSDDLSVENMDAIKGSENYRAYLVNMDGSIDRCLADIEKRCVLPVKMLELVPEQEPIHGFMTRIEINAPDFYEVERVSKESLYEYDGDCSYMREGNTLLFTNFDTSAKYRLMYFPRVTRTVNLSDTDEIGLPEEIAAAVPYFIKGELFREDEPNEASEARNWYESAILTVARPRITKQNSVVSKYSQVW
jgi:hypothetical protein